MNRTTMWVLLVICGIVLIIAVIAFIPRLKNALARIPLIAYLGVVIALIAVVALLVVGLFGPKGSDSLTSEAVDGVEQGDADIDTDLSKAEDGTGTKLTAGDVLSGNEIGDNTIYIRICADEITIGGVKVDDVDAFTTSMQSIMEEDHPVCLIDNYATSRTYTAVRDALDAMGAEYAERQE